MSAKLKIKTELKDYLILMAQMERLNPEDEAELLKNWRCGDEVALRSLVESYLPLALAWIAPRRGQGRSFQQLIALGNQALLAALKSYRGPANGIEAAMEAAVQGALNLALKK